jgi:hypothetical protein
MLRRTAKRLSDERPHPVIDAAHAPPADDQYGLFGKLNGSLAILRVIDPKWMLNRLVSLGRDGYVGAWGFWSFMYAMWWVVPMGAKWGDGKPPRKVDWNKEEAGRLPKGFVQTTL